MSGLEVKHITKKFGQVTALDDVSLTIENGKIYGLLGRNGAGKSTLLNIITNRIFPDDGEVLVGGLPARENDAAQQQIYMMSEKGYYPDSMRVSEAFKCTESFYGGFDREYAMKLCDLFGLNPKKKIKELSTGYGSIFKLIAALCVSVPFILLDEPVLGLDANHRELLYKLLMETFAQKPRTIVISTHLIEEVSSLIEEVIIIKKGQIIRQQPTEELLSMGYTVSGPAAKVDEYLSGMELLGEDTLGGLKTAYLMGQPGKEALPEYLQIGKMDLQKLFIRLTNE
jgi:ABC-2 type transport system ATP-binding protein